MFCRTIQIQELMLGQVLILGAGTDTSFWRLQGLLLRKYFMYAEVYSENQAFVKLKMYLSIV